MPFAIAWMDLECIILSKISQTEKDKYHMISIISDRSVPALNSRSQECLSGWFCVVGPLAGLLCLGAAANG